MVGHFSSREFVHAPDYGQSFDYSREAFTGWKEFAQLPRIEVERKKDIGLLMPIGKDEKYFQPEFGNARNARTYTSINNAGKYFSKAYNVKSSIDQFMVHDYMPENSARELTSVYYRLRDFASKKGYKSRFEITNFSSGYLPDRAIAGVLPVSEDISIFFKSNRFGEWVKSSARKHKVGYDSAALYVLMHEFMHLFGVKGQARDEADLESIIVEFTDKEIKNLYNSAGHSQAKAFETARMLREIRTIAKSRYGSVYENYGSAKIMQMYSCYAKEALDKGINTKEGIHNYAVRKTKEKLYSNPEKTKNRGKNPESKATSKKSNPENRTKSEAKPKKNAKPARQKAA